MRTQASLDDEQVFEMAELAPTLEETMEHPVDKECAYAGGESAGAGRQSNGHLGKIESR